MYSKEVNERSPLRVFEKSIHGGLGRGNLGVVISRPGVGKSTFLVGIALDDLMRERKVLHVSVGDTVDHVRKFYDMTFLELAKTTGLREAERVRLHVERRRHIHSYQPGTFRADRLRDEARFLREHAEFTPDVLLVDNFPFGDASKEDIGMIKDLAGELNAEVWLTALSHRETPKGSSGYPDPVMPFDEWLDVKIYLEPVEGSIRLRLLKDHENESPGDLMIELDPTTLLLKDRARA
ncbi:MAG: hypothetical protein ABIK65_07770 [Candidatus Eisenbacteria bacterium]